MAMNTASGGDFIVKRKLYSNVKRLTTMFLVCIMAVTACTLTLRLTVFSDIASAETPDTLSTGSDSTTGSGEGDLFTYQINQKIYFPRPDAMGNVLIRNPETNEYLMSVSIRLPDSKDDLIYTGYLKPGVPYDSASLNVLLEEDVYDCVAEIRAYDLKTNEFKSKLEVPVQLYVGIKPED